MLNLSNFDSELVIFYSNIFSCQKLWYFDIGKFNYQKHSGRMSNMYRRNRGKECDSV